MLLQEGILGTSETQYRNIDKGYKEVFIKELCKGKER